MHRCGLALLVKRWSGWVRVDRGKHDRRRDRQRDCRRNARLRRPCRADPELDEPPESLERSDQPRAESHASAEQRSALGAMMGVALERAALVPVELGRPRRTDGLARHRLAEDEQFRQACATGEQELLHLRLAKAQEVGGLAAGDAAELAEGEDGALPLGQLRNRCDQSGCVTGGRLGSGLQGRWQLDDVATLGAQPQAALRAIA